MIETHCHLDMLKDVELDRLIDEIHKKGVEKLITISTHQKNFSVVKSLADQFKDVYFSQGVHPHSSENWSHEAKQSILQNIPHPKLVAIGEIGLDFYYNKSPKEAQIKAFTEQIELAIELDLPIIIHTREAEEETMLSLTPYLKDLKRKGVLHSFTSSQKILEWALEHDFYLGFNGIITFKNAEDVRDRVRAYPLEKILIETDSPFLAPVPHRGKQNTPVFLPHVAEAIAEIKNVSVDEVVEITTINAKNLFSF